MQRANIHKIILLILIVAISATFLAMILPFLKALLLAGIFAALAQPFFRRLIRLLGGRRRLAAALTLLLFVLVILLPLSALVGVITSQAIKVGQSITPWVQQQVAEPGALGRQLERVPYYEQLAPYRQQIISRAGQLAGNISQFLVHSLSAGALGTVNFILMSFIFLYAGYFFLTEGRGMLNRMLYYLPLEDKDERRLLEKFTSVTRATLKGTAVIGVLQGSLAGFAFAVVGIDAAVFWGTVMAVLSIIPGIGSPLIWVPAAIILAAGGQYLKAVGLALFCGLVVGSLDNVLRPRLVGKDAKMHDLMIFMSTLGGLALFGFSGFVIGPIVAAIFITIWDIYGEVFSDILPAVNPGKSKSDAAEEQIPEALPPPEQADPEEQSETRKGL